MKNSPEELISKYAPLWPILTFATLLLGYIGFYSYCFIHHLPFINPDISVVAGMGIFCILFIAIIYFNVNKKRRPTVAIVLWTYPFIDMFAHPWILGAMLLLYLMPNSFFPKIKNKTRSFSERRKNLRKAYIRQAILEILIIATSFIVSFFYDANNLGRVMGIYFYALFIYQLKTKILSSTITFLILIVATPWFLTYIYFQDAPSTPFGLSKEFVTISTTDKKTVKGRLLFKDQTYLYIGQEQGNRSDSIQLIPHTRADQITVKSKIIKPVGLIEHWGIVKKLWGNSKNHNSKIDSVRIKKDTLKPK